MNELLIALQSFKDSVPANTHAGINWQAVMVLYENLKDQEPRLEYLRNCIRRRGWNTLGVYGNNGTNLYLSPKGMAYYVGYAGHSGLYDGVMRLPQRTLDEAGWLHISNSRVDISTRPTKAQIKWLADNAPAYSEDGLDPVDGKEIWRYYDAYEGGNCQADYSTFSRAGRSPCRSAAEMVYDVRPVADGDWGTLLGRIHYAQANARHTELAD